jgi:uncharacterized Zn finger protein
MPAHQSPTGLPRPWVTVTSVAIVLLGVLHTLVIALWVAPPSIVKDTVGGAWLSAYVRPVFDQSWSIFAPIPQRGSVSLEVRAMLRDDDTPTRWVDVTGEETATVQSNPSPTRMAIASRRIASTLADGWQRMDDEQRAAALEPAAPASAPALKDRLEKAAAKGGDPSSVELYLQGQESVAHYGTLVARGLWGADVIDIQVRTTQYFVQEYGRSPRLSAQPPVQHGWWTAAPVTDDAQAAFDDYVGRWDVAP